MRIFPTSPNAPFIREIERFENHLRLISGIYPQGEGMGSAYQYGFVIEDNEIWYRKQDGSRSNRYARSKVAFMHCGFREYDLPEHPWLIHGNPVTDNAVILRVESMRSVVIAGTAHNIYYQIIFKDGREPKRLRYEMKYRLYGDIIIKYFSDGISEDEVEKLIVLSHKMLNRQGEKRPYELRWP